MLSKALTWFKPLPDAQPLTDEQEIKRLYRSWRIKMFFSMYQIVCASFPRPLLFVPQRLYLHKRGL